MKDNPVKDEQHMILDSGNEMCVVQNNILTVNRNIEKMELLTSILNIEWIEKVRVNGLACSAY